MAEEKSFKYVISGADISAGYAAREFARQGLKHGELAIISNEPASNKIFGLGDIDIETNTNLSKNYICGGPGGTGEESQSHQWYKDKGIELILSTEIIKADLSTKSFFSTGGTIFKYQTLIVATGSTVSTISSSVDLLVI
ncbi:PREDICTED: probable monodehydroascorbate reductase, cytoplasmic isoform 1 [Brassica oleracea var. oleracea]|uniref:probable monodehydroascorbate reductase, cytoplasmic isoform 1 n=1 Tax=Brassica oleracea var. oleracea TaxID=109376 RepID=UPI0006A6BA75|nr:PREDICTED: probable monodehydroascorbate reductase, cytoplasmic isoform 1 [Brassica oleracea var. oleracea]